jgi:hypothetical protein
MGLFKSLFGKSGSKLPAYLRDHQLPERRLVHGFLALYTGDDGDPRHSMDQEANRRHLEETWGCEHPGDLIDLMNRYETEGECNLAFDLVRVIKLARNGAGAAWISDEESWQRCYRSAQRLRGRYRRWEDVYLDCQAGRQQWWLQSQEQPVPPDQVQYYAARYAEANKLIFATLPLDRT